MVRKCIYCGKEVGENSVIDFCERCGVGVWGQKMFKTIVKNMEEAREKDDLVSTNTIGLQDFNKKKFK
jgi:hypothetical protein